MQLKSLHSWQTKFTNESIPNNTSYLHYHIKFVFISFNFERTCRVIASSTGFTWLEHCPLVLHNLAGYTLTPVSSAGGCPLGQEVASCPSHGGSAFRGEEGAFLVTFLAAWLSKKLIIIVKNIIICIGRVRSKFLNL